MPRDDWQRAKNRDIARRAAAQQFAASTARKRRPSRKKKCFTIPAGTQVSIQKVDEDPRRWQRHTTRVSLTFSSYVSKSKSTYTFECQGWKIRIRKSATNRA